MVKKVNINGVRRWYPAGFVNPLALGSLAVLSIVYGTGYFFADMIDFVGEEIRMIEFARFPNYAYGTIWAGAGVAGLVGMYSRAVFRYAYSSLTSLFFVWAFLYAAVYAVVGVEGAGALISSAVWGSLALATHTLVIIELTDNKTVEAVEQAAREAVDDTVDDRRTDGDPARE